MRREVLRLVRYGRFSSPSLDPMTMPRSERIRWNVALAALHDSEEEASRSARDSGGGGD